MSLKGTTTLGPGLRRGDVTQTLAPGFRRGDVTQTLGLGLRRGDNLTSPRRKPGPSVVSIVAAVLISSASITQAQDWISLEKTSPEALFTEKCGMCHHATGMGTGILARRMDPELALLENRRDLQPEFIRTAVRAGFGVMFPISRAELSDAQLQVLVDYLTSKEAAR